MLNVHSHDGKQPRIPKTITTHDGKTIRIPQGTDIQTVDILRQAVCYLHREFHYTGNHPNGDNSSNDGQEAFVRAAGLWDDRDKETEEVEDWQGRVDEDDNLIDTITVPTRRADIAGENNGALLYHLPSGGSGTIETLPWGKKRLMFHYQGRKGESHGEFGYTWECEYRIIRVEDR